MAVLDLEKIPKPVRLNLSYGRVVAYPHRKDMNEESQIVHQFDPENTGYVLIESYANCGSKELSKRCFLTHRDVKMIIEQYTQNEKFRIAIEEGAQQNAIEELKRLRSTGASLTTLQSAGKDYGIDEFIIIEIFQGGYLCKR